MYSCGFFGFMKKDGRIYTMALLVCTMMPSVKERRNPSGVIHGLLSNYGHQHHDIGRSWVRSVTFIATFLHTVSRVGTSKLARHRVANGVQKSQAAE
jgi:hypothetical protein